MRNFLFYASILLASGFLISSCNKDAQLVEKDVQVSVDENSKLVNDYLKLFNDDYAYFESEDALRNFMIELKNLPYTEQKEVFNGLKYPTFEGYISDIYDGMDALESVEVFENYIKNYENYLEIISTTDGEREVSEKEKVTFDVYPILNADRIIKVGDKFQLFIASYIVESDNISNLKRIKNIEDIISSGLPFNDYRASSRGRYSRQSYRETHNPRRCKNDRRLTLEVGYEDVGGTSVIAPYAELIAQRKGFPCIWYRSNASISWSNFYFKSDINGTASLDWQINITLTNYGKSIRVVDNTSVQRSPMPSILWTKQRSYATTSVIPGAININL
jgi:hypothetical protein